MQSFTLEADFVRPSRALPLPAHGEKPGKSGAPRVTDRIPLADLGLAARLDMGDDEILALCVEEWAGLLALHAGFSDWFECVDTSVCDTDELASLIDNAPNPTVVHALGEMVYCRQQLAAIFGFEFSASASAKATFDEASEIWAKALGKYPAYATWLHSIDRFSCDKKTLVHAIRTAPCQEIRQALREMFCFRETCALSNSHRFE